MIQNGDDFNKEKDFRDRGSGFKMIREIPIIDFSGFNSDNKKLRNSVAKKVHEAASKVGFMYEKNIIFGKKSLIPRCKEVPVIIPLPKKKHYVSIYQLQKNR